MSTIYFSHMPFNKLFRASIIASFAILSTNATAQSTILADDMPQGWKYTEMFDQTLPTSDTWWKEFRDPVLDSLISVGVENNYDVLTAQRRIEMARQNLKQINAGYYPLLSFSGGWNANRTSGVTTNRSMPATKAQYFDLGIDMSWQIDVFGKVSAKARQGKAQVQASRAEYAAMMVTVSAKIASAYMQMRTLQTEIVVLDKHIAQQRRVVEITKARHEAGLVSGLDVAQSLTTQYSTEAAKSSLENSLNAAINTIAVLTGVFPYEISQALTAPTPMPDYHQIVAVGMPMELLRRRPDVVDAEYTLAGYAAAVGVAKKDFLPTLSLTGSIGTMSHKADNLFTQRIFTYSIAPTLSWTIFDGMSRKAAVESAKQQMMTGIDNYNSTILTAVQEVDNAMSAYYHNVEYIDTIEKVVEQAEKSFEMSIDLYKQGLTNFINVTNAQISYLTYSNELIEARGQALASLVNLYEALGGGWSNN